MSNKVKASFSRRPVVDGLKITGTLKRGGDRTDGVAFSVVNQDDADELIGILVKAIDTSDFDVETLDVTLG